MGGSSENLGARARRSAADLLDRIDRIWTGKTHLDGLEDPGTIDEVRRRKTELADGIDEEWANLVLLALWDSRRGEKDEIRAHAKDALRLLAAKNTHGSSRSLDDLARLVSLCLMEHEYRSEEIGGNWRSDEPGGYVVIDISGADLPTAVDARELFVARAPFDDFEKNLKSMCRVVSLGVDPAGLFSAERFPHLSKIPAKGAGKRIWRELLLRLWVLMGLSMPDLSGEDGIVMIPDGSSFQLALEGGEFIVFQKEEVESCLSLRKGSGPTAYPVVRSGGRLWTSRWLLMDSIAPWLCEKIEEDKGLRQVAISQPFEDEVVEMFRDHGFEAGPVNDKGVWVTGDGESRRHHLSDERIPGQIDVLAEDKTRKQFILMECKSMYPMAKITGIAEKLRLEYRVDDSGQPEFVGFEWRNKLRAKREWVERALGMKCDFTAIVVEGVGYVSDSETETDIPLITKDILGKMLEAL